MKTINTGKKHFAGTVIMRDKEIYIDTSNGTGFREVFQEMDSAINMLSNGNWSLGFRPVWDVEDMKQDISLTMLEAIVKYDPSSGTKLSTFLWAVGRNKAIDNYRKAARGRTKYLCYLDEANLCIYDSDPNIKIELLQRIKGWDDTWRNIMFRIFVKGENISDVAESEGWTPWGLTRAIRKKLKEARKV